ncbi:MAG: hypothetical protein J07HX64_03057 [halophilic archaeon J07HX64]|nr:MAG: hypothetical protein J07HX64_03057 [halophilic archaeon J07HX64]
METNKRGEVTLLGGALEIPHHVLCTSRVEAGDRFVCQQHLRSLDQGPGDTNTLLLAPTHTTGLLSGLVEEPDSVECFQGSLFLTTALELEDTPQESNLVDTAGQCVRVRRHVVDYIVLLEYHRNLGSGLSHRFPVDDDLPVCRLRQRTHTPQ